LRVAGLRSTVAPTLAGLLLVGPCTSGLAQTPNDTAVRVLVTGSNLPATERESALPVQIISRTDLEQANLRTAAEVVNTISASMSFSGINEAQGLGPQAPGYAAAALRGLSYQATLVLVNGRRLATYAFAPRGVDLNAIPVAAVDRVEVLKNGASAIYGSDAVAGVINFILRKDYSGIEVRAQYAAPQATGGHAKEFTLMAGAGDRATQGFNAYVTADYVTAGAVQAGNRSFAARRYVPEGGLDQTSINAFPANVSTPFGARNPTGDPAQQYLNPVCQPPLSIVTANAASLGQCRWNGDGSTSITDASERLNVAATLTWQFAAGQQLYANGLWSRNRYEYVTWPTLVSNQTTLLGRGFELPPDSPYYPQAFAQFFGIDSAPLNLFWNTTEAGPRTLDATAEQLTGVAGARGTVHGWTYDTALSYSRSEADQQAARGYFLSSALLPILNSGVVNPFGPNTPVTLALLGTAAYEGTMRHSTSTTTSVDAVASTDLVTLPFGPLQLALGGEWRRETLDAQVSPSVARGDVLNVDAAGPFAGERDSWGMFAEANLPFARNAEANLAVRYDRYSDFGGTTNPQLSLRWQPERTLLLRASTGTGYQPPGLQGVYRPTGFGFTPNTLSDPARCPVTASAQDCNRTFRTVVGGNPDLGPVESFQWSVGGVWAPIPEISLGVDFVSILADNRINFFSATQILDGCPDGVNGATCYLIRRGPVEPAFPSLPGPIITIDQRLTNLGQWKVEAIDVAIGLKPPAQPWGQVSLAFTGSYTRELLRQEIDGSYVNQVGSYVSAGGNPGVVPRWRHNLMIGWQEGPWQATLHEVFQTGGHDQEPAPGTGGKPRIIDDYDVWNLSLAYTGFRNVALSAGVKNLFDTDPPFSNQTQSFQVGYDPSYADPRGRLWWAALRYQLH
jgi:iron complex outermembrane receptor protein